MNFQKQIAYPTANWEPRTIGITPKEKMTITVVGDKPEFTTEEAASILGVSHEFLANMLKNDEIPSHPIYVHPNENFRRIYVEDLFKYKVSRDAKRRQILDDLVKAEVREGLYDREPSDL